MSDSEYESEYDDSEYDDSECDDSEYEGEDDDSSDSETTYTSLEAALADMTARLAELDTGLHSMATTTQVLEHPVTAVAVSAFTNPRVLETAPFRATKFRLKPAAKVALGTPHHTVTFSELCAAVRTTLRERGDVLGATKFLEVLRRLPEIVE